MTINKELFFDIQNNFFSNIPFNQTKEWLESTGDFGNTVFFINNPNYPELCCWGRVFNRKLIGKHLLIDGIAINTDKIKTIREFFFDLSKDGYSLIELSDITFYNEDYEIGIRQAGFIRPMLSLSPLTLIVNLQNPFSFHRNWRRNIRKSEEQGIVFEVVENPEANDAEAFVRLFNKLKRRKNLSFTLTTNSIITLLKNNKYKLFFTKDKNNNYLSGRIIYVFNKKSYDVYAANSDLGIKCGAAYLIQEKILLYLRELGVGSFDYGRIPPSNDAMNNIYIAKSYSGGEPAQYIGQWIYSKNKRGAMLLEFYKFFVKNLKRY